MVFCDWIEVARYGERNTEGSSIMEILVSTLLLLSKDLPWEVSTEEPKSAIVSAMQILLKSGLLCNGDWQQIGNWNVHWLSTGVDNRLMTEIWADSQWRFTTGWWLKYGLNLNGNWWCIGEGFFLFPFLFFSTKLERPHQTQFEFPEFWNIPWFKFYLLSEHSTIYGAPWACDFTETQL